jgi:hypothetical protein
LESLKVLVLELPTSFGHRALKPLCCEASGVALLKNHTATSGHDKIIFKKKKHGNHALGQGEWASLARLISHREIQGFVHLEALRQNHIRELRGNVSQKCSWKRQNMSKASLPHWATLAKIHQNS